MLKISEMTTRQLNARELEVKKARQSEEDTQAFMRYLASIKRYNKAEREGITKGFRENLKVMGVNL